MSHPMFVWWSLECGKCGFHLILGCHEKEPTVYRFCPKCGERTLSGGSEVGPASTEQKFVYCQGKRLCIGCGGCLWFWNKRTSQWDLLEQCPRCEPGREPEEYLELVNGGAV